jgi:hypothetical protein
VLVLEVVVDDAVAEVGVVGDLAKARPCVTQLAERLERRLGEGAAPLVVLVGGRLASRRATNASSVIAGLGIVTAV